MRFLAFLFALFGVALVVGSLSKLLNDPTLATGQIVGHVLLFLTGWAIAYSGYTAANKKD